MLKALLVDDSIGSIRTLRTLLKKFCPQVNIVGEADSPEKAYEIMLSQKPNLLLLDIEMPLGTGFDLIERAKDFEFEVIFITAHEHYALEAIKHKALDYLLKPIGHINLMESIKRAETRIKEKNSPSTPDKTSEKPSHSSNQKLPIPTSNGFEFIPINEILYLEADGVYSIVLTKAKQKIMTTLRIGDMEDKLTDKGFFRIHRSYLINMSYIQQYYRGNGGYVVMENGTQLPVARNRKDNFLKHLEM